MLSRHLNQAGLQPAGRPADHLTPCWWLHWLSTMRCRAGSCAIRAHVKSCHQPTMAYFETLSVPAMCKMVHCIVPVELQEG